MKTVLLGLSGGVDSAVAVILLKKKGYKVVGAFMKNFSDVKNKVTGECNWVNDKKDAQKVASKLEIPFIFLDFEKEYKKKVIDPMFSAYKSGLTPNPDSWCNKNIKFPLLWNEAKKIGADYIATGHYIRKKKTRKGYKLLRPKDNTKDQSYFLYTLTQKDIEHSLFPIGEYTKKQVRQIAKKYGLHNFEKKGSKGICFVGKTNMKSFLKQKIPEKKGKVINSEGKIIGTHEGMHFYTIGERVAESSGIKIQKNNEKWYISGKIPRKNIVIASPSGHPSLMKTSFKIKNANWISEPTSKVKVRIRHLGELIPARLDIKNKTVRLTKPVFGLAAGQSAVFYKRSIVLGGAEIA